MTVELLYLVGAIYAWIAYTYTQQGRWGMALAFIAYSVANIGFVVDALAWKGRG